MKRLLLIFVLLCAAALMYPLPLNFRFFDHPGYTRIVFETPRSFVYSIKILNPRRFMIIPAEPIDFQDALIIQNSQLLGRIVYKKRPEGKVLVIHLKRDFEIKKSFTLENPARLVLDIAFASPGAAPNAAPKAKAENKAAFPT